MVVGVLTLSRISLAYEWAEGKRNILLIMLLFPTKQQRKDGLVTAKLQERQRRSQHDKNEQHIEVPLNLVLVTFLGNTWEASEAKGKC